MITSGRFTFCSKELAKAGGGAGPVDAQLSCSRSADSFAAKTQGTSSLPLLSRLIGPALGILGTRSQDARRRSTSPDENLGGEAASFHLMRGIDSILSVIER